MKKYIVLSVNDNPEYLQYVPLTVWSWKRIGWEPIVMFRGSDTKSALLSLDFHGWLEDVTSIKGYRDDTVTQISRLYAACVLPPESLIMLGDIDMLACSDFWHPNPKKITVYNHDLTNFADIPMCYVAMTRERWVEVIGLTSDDYNALIKRDLDTLPNAKSEDFYKYWGIDQELLTKRLNAVNFEKEYINRGRLSNGYARQRIDRGSWNLGILEGNEVDYIDCHMHRDLYKIFQPNPSDLVAMKWRQHLSMLSAVWPKEDFGWYFNFVKKFASLV